MTQDSHLSLQIITAENDVVATILIDKQYLLEQIKRGTGFRLTDGVNSGDLPEELQEKSFDWREFRAAPMELLIKLASDPLELENLTSFCLQLLPLKAVARRPTIIIADGLIKVLIERGIVPPNVRRCVIDMVAQEPIMVYHDCFGDERLLEVFRDLPAVTVNIPEEKESPSES